MRSGGRAPGAAMRIANLLPGSGNAAYPGLQVPASFVGADVQVELVETGVYLEPRDPAASALASVAFVAAAAGAEREGFDAAFINTTADYGLAEIRAVVEMPVVGAGESGASLAASFGRQFALVQVWPEWSRWLDEQMLSDAGLIDRCCSIRHVSTEGEEDYVHAAMVDGESGGREEMVSRISEEVERAAHEDGADAILLGCTCMSAVAEQLAERVDVPVVDPLKAGYLAAERLARLGVKAPGLAPVRQRQQLLPLFEEVTDVLRRSGVTSGNQVEECAVCAPIHPDLVETLDR